MEHCERGLISFARKMHTIKQSDYKHLFIDDEEFNNYCLTYEYIGDRDIHGYYPKGRSRYTARNHDRKEIMEQLYNHSKKKRFFTLVLMQYRQVPLDELLID